jgi:hypothetical protein
MIDGLFSMMRTLEWGAGMRRMNLMLYSHLLLFEDLSDK